MQENLTPSHIMANTPLASLSFLDTPLQSLDSAVSIPGSETFVSNSRQPNIAIIGAAAFLYASKLLGSYNFELCLCSSDIQANSAKLAETPDLSNIPSEYHEFADIFSKTKAETLSPHCPYDLKINLEKGAQPSVGPIYSLSASEQEALKEFIEENLNMGFIQPTSSLHSAPVLFVKKKDGSLRFCVDFRRLNHISKKDCYLLLLISNLLDSSHKAWVYSKIDLCHAYHLVHIANGDEWKTVFRTRYGSFEWSVMLFSLTNASTAFQRFMNNIFSDLLDVYVVIYLDDILIYSNNMSKHHQHMKEVLKHLYKTGLYAKVEKCKFHSESVEYLGYILSPSSLTISDDKVKIIQDWPEPKKVKDIQSFLGFANFYYQFIFNYLNIVIPLICLTQKDISWKFDSSCQDAFNSLKKAFTSAPILIHWISDAQLIVETNASDYALAAILSIINEDNKVHPVAFHSHTFTTVELNYDTHDKELLAIFKAFKIWWHYLEDLAYPIDVVMNHKNLKYFSTTKILTQKQAQWSEYLSQFNLVIRFRPGRLGTKPDALTRQWNVYLKEGNTGYATVNFYNFKPIFTQEQLAASVWATVLLFPSLYAAIVVDLDTLHQDILLALSSNPIDTKHISTDGRWSTDPNGLLLLDNRIYVLSASNLHTCILQYNHDHILAGYFGQNKTLELVRHGYS